MLKKQTVWLLTMLSLMIVLSAYYLMSDKEDFAYIQTDQEASENASKNNENEDVEINEIEEVESDDILTMIRMEMDDERSMKKDRLQEIVASGNATTEEINEAMNEIDEIESLSTKEKILQETIMTNHDTFDEVLVRAESGKAHVHVITDELGKNEAVEIMREVHDELGDIPVDVNFQENVE